jgi:capsular polysaccharide transport system permease protein
MHRESGRIEWPLILIVAIPAVLAALYFGFWASDVYVSESKFVVRSPEKPSMSTLGNLLQGAGVGMSKSPDDAQTVREYIMSRDALRFLDEQLGVMSAYASKRVDIFSRFAGLDPDDSFEAFHRYFERKVDVQLDSNSSIVSLGVRAFSPEVAEGINKALLEQSEHLVNRLNSRARSDLINFAENEVLRAERKAKDAAIALSRYRSAQSVVDPERQAASQLQQVMKLQDELMATRTQLSQLESVAPSNPQIPTLRIRVRALQEEISKANQGVTGAGGSLAKKAVEFQQLALEAEFANKQLATALASLEQARNEAQRKQFYLERIAQPSRPDVAQEPRRLRNAIATVVFAVAAWSILTMLLAGIREHRN